MDTRQLRTLLAIAEQGSFSKAAAHLNLTPSAVSQQMQSLEVEVGVPLFDRSSRPPRPNTAGMQMLDAARELVRTAEDAIGTITGRKVVGTLAIGSVRTSALSLLPKAIVELRERNPDLRIKLRVGLSDALLQDVAAGRLDAAMVAENRDLPTALRWNPFIREPLYVIAPPGSKQMTDQEFLRTFPYIRFRAAVPLAQAIDHELARMNISLNEIAEIDTISSITSCVANGLGVSVVPDIAVRECPSPLVTAPFGDPVVTRRIGLAQRHGSPRAMMIEQLLTDLRNVSGEHASS
ncbi:LysR family transcriptional regulator [Falsirhodobacter xinxiangensis]|uniref:LysR family transcriptional regulator n=1 Tax=Falsirhodobacter xinxiangensis TaxID=2530049 RepID=UPI0010A9A542|nr:LysR family transcriptional regulator [Rhodobacter xinxiangensis]